MAYHIIPNDKEFKVQTTKMDGTWSNGTFSDLYPYAKDKSLILKHQVFEGRKGMITQQEIYLKFKEAIMQFLNEEKNYMDIYSENLNLRSPFKKSI